MEGALRDVTVVDLSWGMAGPMASGQLADHGAQVIRVEPPGGDPYRPFVSHAAYDRSKRSIVVDITTPGGHDIVHRLLDDADVLIESFQPGVADSLGLGYEALAERYPRLIYCSISGYGATASARDRPGYDSLVSARLGAMAEVSVGDDVELTYLGVPIASIGTGLMSVIGITAALVEREETGLGQWVETSMFDGALSFMNMYWGSLENLVEAPAGSTMAGPRTRRLVIQAFRCGDGEYIGVHTGANGSHARLMECLGLSDRILPAPGPREKTVPLTEDEADVLHSELPKILASQPRAHWLELLRSHDVTAIAYLRQTEALFEPQAVHNGSPVRVVDPELGEVTQVGLAAHLTLTPGGVRGPAPLAGQDTDALLREIGFDDDEVAGLHRSAVVG
jgi:crotonobetainyl-CoA:carnitine CoA-transferase CaiB-like acyl-CoA transferase